MLFGEKGKFTKQSTLYRLELCADFGKRSWTWLFLFSAYVVFCGLIMLISH